ncbi:CRE-ASP-1 protein, partial [Aphelenchoides avenae]
FSGFSVKQQQFGVVQTLPDFYDNMAFDGTFGLGWPSLAVDGATPPIQNVLAQLDNPLFSIWLGSKPIDQQYDQGGAITYGALDTDHCNSQWSYVPLTSLSYWQFEVSSVQIRSSKFTRRQQVNAAIAAPWLYGPAEQIAAIAKAAGGFDMFGDGFYYVDCTNGRPTLPDIVFTAGGNTFIVPGNAYLDP